MKSKEEIEKLANDWLTKTPIKEWGGAENGFMQGYTQCQEDMADKIKEAYEQGLSHGYACMPATISPLNKQD